MLGLVAVEDGYRSQAPQNVSEFPGQVARAGEAGIVAQSAGRDRNVSGVTDEKDPPMEELRRTTRGWLPHSHALDVQIDLIVSAERGEDTGPDCLFGDGLGLADRYLAPPPPQAVERLKDGDPLRRLGVEQRALALADVLRQLGVEDHVLHVHRLRGSIELGADDLAGPACRAVGREGVGGGHRSPFTALDVV